VCLRVVQKPLPSALTSLNTTVSLRFEEGR
jgi:hypothetical protein